MAERRLIDELFAKLAEERGRLLAQARSVSEEAARVVPQDGEGEAQWTMKEQWAHLAEMETNYRAWIRAGADQDGVDLRDVAGEPPAIGLTDALAHSNDALIRQLVEQRAATLALLESMKPEQFDHRATQPMFGTLTVMQWARSYYRHDRMHVDQIAGRDPEYKPRFAGGTEPDQRRRA